MSVRIKNDENKTKKEMEKGEEKEKEEEKEEKKQIGEDEETIKRKVCN